jgi:hypothetical protein
MQRFLVSVSFGTESGVLLCLASRFPRLHSHVIWSQSEHHLHSSQPMLGTSLSSWDIKRIGCHGKDRPVHRATLRESGYVRVGLQEDDFLNTVSHKPPTPLAEFLALSSASKRHNAQAIFSLTIDVFLPSYTTGHYCEQHGSS